MKRGHLSITGAPVLCLLALLLAGTPVFGETISISTSYNNLLSNPESTGILDRVVVEAFDRIGVECEIIYTQTEQALVDVNAGILDAELNRIAGLDEQYPNLVRVPEPNMVMRFVAFSTRDIPIEGWESIRGLNIGLVRGWKILEAATSGFPYVTYVPTEVELFEMLRLGRIDVALYSELTGRAAVSDYGPRYGAISPLNPALAEREMYLYLHKDHADLVPPVAEALREMKRDGRYDTIFRAVLEGL